MRSQIKIVVSSSHYEKRTQEVVRSISTFWEQKSGAAMGGQGPINGVAQNSGLGNGNLKAPDWFFQADCFLLLGSSHILFLNRSKSDDYLMESIQQCLNCHALNMQSSSSMHGHFLCQMRFAAFSLKHLNIDKIRHAVLWKVTPI